MAIQQVVNVNLLLTGDASATSFTFSPARLFAMQNGDNGQMANLLTPASSASVVGVPSGWVVPTASVDTWGNLTLTFSSAPPAATGIINLQLNFNSLSLSTAAAAWTSATAVNSTASVACNGFGTVLLTYNPVSSAFTAGTIVFEASDDNGTTWYAINGERGNQSFVPDNAYILNAVQQYWSFDVAGFTNFRVRLSVAITGSGTANFHVLTLLANCDASLTVGQGLGKFLHMNIDGGNSGLVADVTAKGTQGADALTVQDYKDSGRTSLTFYFDQVTGITSEALGTMNIVKALVNQTSATSYTVTAGKTLRLQAITCTCRDTTTTLATSRVRVRGVASGSVAAGSPVIFDVEVVNMPGTAAAGVGENVAWSIPDGFEVPGGGQIGITHLESSTSSTISVCLVGFEY